jgi:hypothetical protein
MKVLEIVDSSVLSQMLGITKEQAACRMSRLKRKYKKPSHSIVTLKEWCEWNGLPLEEMRQYLN